MADHAKSDSPAVQQRLDRLAQLSHGGDVLGLERITALLGRLGNPERNLPPVFHIAGTNGKGSTCAFLRAAIEAAGVKAHVYTSPHLVRFNERIRLGGKLIDDELFAQLLDEVLEAADGLAPSFFEATTAVAFLAFSRHPADACILEVGLGGRLDATNVVATPAICAITQLGLDHQAFLGPSLSAIAGEKAGIAKAGVPLVTHHYPARIANQIGERAAAAGALWLPRGGRWDAVPYQGKLHYRDEFGKLAVPIPRLQGAHQVMNAALAIAIIRHQNAVAVPPPAIRAAMGWAEWPGRLQRLSNGPLVELLPAGSELWLDGGHNGAAARAIADFFRSYVPAGRPFHLIVGLLENKDAQGLIKPFRTRPAGFHGVPVDDHVHHSPAALAAVAHDAGLAAEACTSVEDALISIARAKHEQPPIVLIFGSLYLAGDVLRMNGQIPV